MSAFAPNYFDRATLSTGYFRQTILMGRQIKCYHKESNNSNSNKNKCFKSLMHKGTSTIKLGTMRNTFLWQPNAYQESNFPVAVRTIYNNMLCSCICGYQLVFIILYSRSLSKNKILTIKKYNKNNKINNRFCFFFTSFW